MPPQKGSWTYTTRYHTEGDGRVYSGPSGSNVTSVCLWAGICSDGAQGKERPRGKATASPSRSPVSQPTQDIRSMKISFHSKHDAAPDKLANITKKVYDDPAFSPDPLANPLFASNHPPAWASPPGPGHPTLQKQPRPLDGEEFLPPQPPNTPAVPEPPEAAKADNKRQSHLPKSTAPSNPGSINSRDTPRSTDSASSSSSALLTSAIQLPSSSSSASSSDPSSSDPHVHPKDNNNTMPHHVQHAPPSKQEPKKRQGFLSRLLGPPSGTESSQSSSSSSSSSPPRSKHEQAMLRMQRPQHPHSHYGTGPRPPPVPIPVPRHHPSRSAPEVRQPERPPMPHRAKTIGTSPDPGRPAEVVPAVAAAAAAAERAADDRRLRQELDRIDELDETNPFGPAVHHRGPYEAISRIVQNPALEQTGRPAQPQATSGRKRVMSGDVYRTVQLMALQKTLNLKPGQILPRDFAPYSEPTFPSPYPHPQPPPPQSIAHHAHPQTPPQPSMHHAHAHAHPPPQPIMYHEQHARHAYPPPSAPMLEPRSSLERPIHTQKAPSVLQVASSLRNSLETPSASFSTNSPPTRRRTPSPSSSTTHSDEDNDAGLAIGIAMMEAGQNNSHASSDTATVVGIEAESPVPIKIVLREPTEVDEPSPPPYMRDPPQASTSRIEAPITSENRSQEPVVVERDQRGGVWYTPPPNMPQQFPSQEAPPQFVPVPAPVPTSSPSRHASWHPRPAQAPPPQQYSRPSRQGIHSMQLPPSQQQLVVPVNPGLSRSSTYAPGSSGPSTDRLMLASSLKSGGGVPPYSSTPSLRDRESDTRSVQQSVMTTSNASSRSQGENPRRNRYLPKRLVMPAPLQPTMQNQASAHQVRFDPQANNVYPRGPAPPQPKRSSTLAPPRAQEIHMAQSNGKLRKRDSLMGGLQSSQVSPPPPVAAVSFSASVVSADKTARGAEKVRKKVLSKRK